MANSFIFVYYILLHNFREDRKDKLLRTVALCGREEERIVVEMKLFLSRRRGIPNCASNRNPAEVRTSIESPSPLNKW